MAAAALLRSMARKIAQSQPPSPNPRLLLSRGLHGSGPSGSLPPQPLAGFGSLANKMARAPPPYQRPLLHERGLHSRTSPNSGSTPSPASKTNFRATLANAKTGLTCIALFTASIGLCAWLVRRKNESRAKMEALTGEMYEIRDMIKAIIHEYDKRIDRARSMQLSGHGKERDGAADKGTRVHNVEEEEEVAKLHRIKELEDCVNNLQAENTELKIALESARSKGKV